MAQQEDQPCEVGTPHSRWEDPVPQDVWEWVPFGVALVDDVGMIQYVNRLLCDMLGYRTFELVGQAALQLFPRRHHSQVHERLRQCPAQPVGRMERGADDFWVEHAQGGEMDASIAWSRVRWRNDVVSLLTVNDIRERKRLESGLKQANADLQEFTYVASHDLRSPLRGIADLLDWIAEDVSAGNMDDVAKNLARAAVRVHRMEVLIDDLLQYARAGRATACYESVALRDVLDGIQAMDPVPAGFELHADIQVGAFQAQKTPLETVLRNLISNAIKHHDQTHGCIRVGASMDGEYVSLTVADDGPGIPEMASQRIFKLFQTLGPSKRGSSGIGLAVCKRLVEVHGGAIEVISPVQNDRGAMFRVKWPAFVRR